MMVVTVLSATLAAIGSLMLLQGAPWFRRQPLAARIRPYLSAAAQPSRMSSSTVLKSTLMPIVVDLGSVITRALGVEHDLAERLKITHSTDSPQEFRWRQFVRAIVALLLGCFVSLLLSLGPFLTLFTSVGVAALSFLRDEQKVSSAVERHQRQLEAELPVVIEQLATLLRAGYSLPAALDRVSERGTGVAAQDIQTVLKRINHGLSEIDALQEWSRTTNVEGVRRLTAVLTMHQETSDIGHLVSQEARASREEAHRGLIEFIEKRAQLVWIPVTVATLVPGLIFLAVPFISAMNQVIGS